MKTAKTLRSDALRVTDCLNLRPADDSDGDVLIPVGSPKVIAEEQWKPLATVGEKLLVYSGSVVGVVTDNGVEQIATLPSAPRCANVGRTYITVMTDDAPYVLLRNDDGSITDVGVKPDFGTIALTAEQLNVYESTIASCAVSKITSAMTAAYREIVETARLGGAFVQPVVARCKLLDSEGNVVYVTAPVAVMLAEGAPLTAAWQFGSDDGGETVRSEIISAPAYRLRLTVGDSIPAAWRKIVQAIEVEATPQFHPIDFSGSADVSIGRATTTDKYIRVMLPGVERGISASRNLASAELLKRAIERFDDIAITVARISNPFDNTADTVISYAAPIDVADEADKLSAALSTAAPSHQSNALTRVQLPHSFTADAVAASADTVVWANIKPKRFGGYSAAVYASTFERRRCCGYIKTDFASGESVVGTFSSDIAPITLSPLITYPSAEAVAMTIAVNVDGESTMRSVTVPLTADTTGKFALYASADLLPIAMDDVAMHAAPAAVAADLTMPGMVGVSNDAAVASVTAVSNVGADVVALTAARSGSSAWEYRRARFYVFANDGIKLLTTNSACTECAVNLLDCRSIDNRYCVSDGGNVVYALSGGQLLQVSANAVKCLTTNVVGDRIAWIAANNEVVIGNTDDSEAVHFIVGNWAGSYSSSLILRTAWLASSGKAYAAAQEGLIALAERNVTASTDIKWQARYTLKGGKRSLPTAVRWMLKASTFAGTLTVARAWLSGVSPKPQTVSRLSVNGAIKSPILCRLNGHNSIDLQLTVEGSVSHDFSLTYPMIVCNK